MVNIPDDIAQAANLATVNAIAEDRPLFGVIEAAIAAVAPLIEAREREICAAVADEYERQTEETAQEERTELGSDYDPNCYGSGFDGGEQFAAHEIAAAIRARST